MLPDSPCRVPKAPLLPGGRQGRVVDTPVCVSSSVRERLPPPGKEILSMHSLSGCCVTSGSLCRSFSKLRAQHSFFSFGNHRLAFGMLRGGGGPEGERGACQELGGGGRRRRGRPGRAGTLMASRSECECVAASLCVRLEGRGPRDFWSFPCHRPGPQVCRFLLPGPQSRWERGVLSASSLMPCAHLQTQGSPEGCSGEKGWG